MGFSIILKLLFNFEVLYCTYCYIAIWKNFEIKRPFCDTIVECGLAKSIFKFFVHVFYTTVL